MPPKCLETRDRREIRQGLEVVLAFARRRARVSQAQSMKAAQEQAHADTADKRATAIRLLHYYEGSGEAFTEVGDMLEEQMSKFGLIAEAKPEG
jgi:hypothetical protein